MNDKSKRARMRLSQERQAELAELAEAVAETHCSAERIDLGRIAAAKEISLIYDHYEEAFDGMIECEGGEFFIHCNLDRENLPDSPRGRFTLAHELGHYFIDEHRNNLLTGAAGPHPSFAERSGEDLQIEQEADFFASRLLLPENRFLSATKRMTANLAGISALAQKFEVSLSCAAIRVVSAEVFPSVIVKWSTKGVSWRWSSKSFWEYGFRLIKVARNTLPHDSATAKAIAHSAVGAYTAENATTAASWFPMGARSARNLILREEAISLGRFGALTLLTLHDRKFPPEVVALRNQELGLDSE